MPTPFIALNPADIVQGKLPGPSLRSNCRLCVTTTRFLYSWFTALSPASASGPFCGASAAAASKPERLSAKLHVGHRGLTQRTDCVQSWFKSRFPGQRKWSVFRCIRSAIVLGATLVAMFVPGFGNFISLIGSLACALLAFVIPTVCHLKIFGKTLPWYVHVCRSCSSSRFVLVEGEAFSGAPVDARRHAVRWEHVQAVQLLRAVASCSAQ